MDYKTLDWDAEAKRLTAAFGIETACVFTEFAGGRMVFRPHYSLPDFLPNAIRCRIGQLFIDYTQTAREFDLYDDELYCNVDIFWDGKAESDIEEIQNSQLAFALAGVLFQLDLLAPEVAAALNLSAHERIEIMNLQLEHE